MLSVISFLTLLVVTLAQHGEYIVNLEHKLGSSDWSHRATLVLSMIKQSSVPAHNTPQYIPVSSNEKIEDLKNLESNDTLYHIRVPYKVIEDDEVVEQYVSTVILACTLLQSDLKSTITIHMDSMGYISGLSMFTPAQSCSKTTTSAETFNTFTKISYASPGTVPDVNSFIEIKEKEEKKKMDEGSDKRSFLAKYWMYILPVALLMMMSMGSS